MGGRTPPPWDPRPHRHALAFDPCCRASDRDMESNHTHIGILRLDLNGHSARAGGGVHETDEFRMYAFKIKRCSKTRNHDWTECPYAHRGEKARRRDPRKYRYLGVACSEFRHTGECSKGQQCEFAHGVFEFWLHPTRYRTRPCKAGVGCQRRVCFFAHTPEQLRVKERDPRWWSCGWWPLGVTGEGAAEEDLCSEMEHLKVVDAAGDGVDCCTLPNIDWICELVK